MLEFLGWAVMAAVAVGVYLLARQQGYDVLGALRRIYDRAVAAVLALIRRADR